jgi:hypothetical protein
MATNPDQTPPTFDEPGMRNISAYFETLKRIHIRLITEGKKISEGKAVHPGHQSGIESQ